jgi:hypothetical protein
VWFALVAAKECQGDLGQLGERLADETVVAHHGRDSAERKGCHLRDLQERLASAGLTVEDVVTAAGELAQKELRRARERVLKPTEREREWSKAMRDTPRERRWAQALRGAWPQFPIDPRPYAKEIGAQFKTAKFYGENASFGVVRKLDAFLDRADNLVAAERFADAQALLRAWMTVVIELMARADDSFGCIGDCFRRGLAAYLKLPLDRTGIEEPVFFSDLLTLLIWEDYGFTWGHTEGYFQGLTRAQGDWCIAFLRQQIDGLRADRLTYPSEKALTLLGQVVAEQDRFDDFESVAREMGAREWQRIIRLADRAVKKRKRPLARQVFEAALTAGAHLDFLRKKYEKLKQGHWSPDPRK